MFKLGKQLDDQGLLALSNSCPSLADLTLSYCTFITDAGIGYLASCSKLSSLKLYDRLAVDKWQKQLVPCENMKELSLVNCIIRPGRGLACILDKCINLEKILLDICVGLRDNDIMGLAQSSRGLWSISLRMPSDFSVPLLMSNRLTLTDESLKALAENCPKLESIRISFSDGEFPSLSLFSLGGILYLIRNCPVRELSLDHVCSFNDDGMEALCSAHCLEKLELVSCQEISDDGLQACSSVFAVVCFASQQVLGSHR